MMRRRKAELTVFSIATLDVFASAMGVFMLIAVILFPYYMKNVDAISARDAARAEALAAQATAAAAEDEARSAKESARRTIEDAADQVAAAEAHVQSAREDAKRALDDAARLERRARAAEQQLRQTFLLVLINWSTVDDVDLHLRDPSNAWFSWERPRIQGRPGSLSLDVRRGPGNEVWQVDSAEPGLYMVCANRFRPRTLGQIRVQGDVYHQDGRLSLNAVMLAPQGDNRVQPMAAIAVDDEGGVALRPIDQVSCPEFRIVDHDPKS